MSNFTIFHHRSDPDWCVTYSLHLVTFHLYFVYFYSVNLYVVIQVISTTFFKRSSLLQPRFSNEQMEALNADDLVATCDAFDCGINSLYVEQARVGAKTCLYVKEDEPSSCQHMAAEPYQSLGHLGDDSGCCGDPQNMGTLQNLASSRVFFLAFSLPKSTRKGGIQPTRGT